MITLLMGLLHKHWGGKAERQTDSPSDHVIAESFPWGECSWDKDLHALISVVCAVPIYPPIFSAHLTFLILSTLLLFFQAFFEQSWATSGLFLEPMEQYPCNRDRWDGNINHWFTTHSHDVIYSHLDLPGLIKTRAFLLYIGSLLHISDLITLCTW